MKNLNWWYFQKKKEINIQKDIQHVIEKLLILYQELLLFMIIKLLLRSFTKVIKVELLVWMFILQVIFVILIIIFKRNGSCYWRSSITSKTSYMELSFYGTFTNNPNPTHRRYIPMQILRRWKFNCNSGYGSL